MPHPVVSGMRKVVTSLGARTLLMALALAACGDRIRDTPEDEQRVVSEQSASREVTPEAGTLDVPPDSVRVFEYLYAYNTADLVENHYMEFEYRAEGVRGTYYGTTDDFDSTREGYAPGFFATRMLELTLRDGHLSFTLAPSDIFVTPRAPGRREEAQSFNDGVRWKGPALAPTRSYSGAISGDTITLQRADATRTFVLKRSTP